MCHLVVQVVILTAELLWLNLAYVLLGFNHTIYSYSSIHISLIASTAKGISTKNKENVLKAKQLPNVKDILAM